MRVLVLGGYGNFGARICRALARHDASLEVLAAGRNPDAARPDFVALGVRPTPLDIAAPGFAAALRALAPAVVIHCVGPFQGQDYRVAEACIASGAHCIDLADGRAFVAGIGALDEAARAADVLVVSGASTLPALSSAVIDRLATEFATLETLESVIAPAQQAPRGAATLAGVLSYVGRGFTLLERGSWRTVAGWRELRREDLGSFRARLAAHCDVPDLALFPARYPGVATVAFRAALELDVQMRMLSLLAALRQAGLPLPLERLAPTLDRIAGWCDRWGSEAGTMTVTVTGRDATGMPKALRWQVIAPANHGPEIPCMAAILLARKLVRGALPARGAMPCMGLVTLDEFAPLFADWGMTTRIDAQPCPTST